MRLVEQPFVTRRDVLGVLRPGEAMTEGPFRTLRQRRAASNGFHVPLRSVSGQVLGRLHLYSALNADAARAYRLNQVDVAQQFALKASELETSDAASYLTHVIGVAAARFGPEQASSGSPGFRRYLASHSGTTGAGLEFRDLAREWLAHAEAWIPFAGGDLDTFEDACWVLWKGSQEARVEIDGAPADSLSTFFGLVSRMDRTAAELEAGDGSRVLVPRDELEREGLASIGQPVALMREALPGGGTYLLPRAAVALGAGQADTPDPSPFDIDVSQSVTTVATLDPADSAWLERELARDPNAVPAAPMPVQGSGR